MGDANSPDDTGLAAASGSSDFPFEESVGYQIRTTHRLLQRLLQTRIEPHGLSLGTWYILRALWAEDGLTQRELSRRIGTMEPTTMAGLRALETAGLVRRVRDEVDRRKTHIHLTPKARGMKGEMLTIARGVVGDAVAGLSPREIALFLDLLKTLAQNVRRHLAVAEADEA